LTIESKFTKVPA